MIFEKNMSKYVCDGEQCFLVDVPSSKEKTLQANDFPQPHDSKMWTVYGAEWCVWCKHTRTLLENEDIKYIDIDHHGGRKTYLESLSEHLGEHKTIPAIFHYGKFIGGYSDLIAHLDMN